MIWVCPYLEGIPKTGIGANSGPAVFADSFLSVFMGMVVFARFFCFFILHVELCMRQVVPFSPGQNGHWILFLLRKTCTECLRPTRSFLRFFFLPLKSLVKRFCSFFLPALPAFLSFESYLRAAAPAADPGKGSCGICRVMLRRWRGDSPSAWLMLWGELYIYIYKCELTNK